MRDAPPSPVGLYSAFWPHRATTRSAARMHRVPGHPVTIPRASILSSSPEAVGPARLRSLLRLPSIPVSSPQTIPRPPFGRRYADAPATAFPALGDLRSQAVKATLRAKLRFDLDRLPPLIAAGLVWFAAPANQIN